MEPTVPPQSSQPSSLVSGAQHVSNSSDVIMKVALPVVGFAFFAALAGYMLLTQTHPVTVQITATSSAAQKSESMSNSLIDTLLPARVTAKREQVKRAMAAFEPSLYERLLTMVENTEAYHGNDIPGASAFAQRWGSTIRTMSTMTQSLQEKNLDTMSSDELDALLAQLAQMQSDKQKILSTYNAISQDEFSKINYESATSASTSQGSQPKVVTSKSGRLSCLVQASPLLVHVHGTSSVSWWSTGADRAILGGSPISTNGAQTVTDIRGQVTMVISFFRGDETIQCSTSIKIIPVFYGPTQ